MANPDVKRGIVDNLSSRSVVRRDGLAAVKSPGVEGIAGRAKGRLRHQDGTQGQSLSRLGRNGCSARRAHFHLAVIDAELRRVGIDAIDALSGDLDLPILIEHCYGVTGQRVFSFHDGGAGDQLQAHIGEDGREHLQGAIVSHAKNDAGAEQNLRVSLTGSQFTSLGNFGKSAKLRFQWLAIHGDRAFKIVNQARPCGNHGLARRRHSSPKERRKCEKTRAARKHNDPFEKEYLPFPRRRQLEGEWAAAIPAYR
jgi:hypothetical protein